MLFALKGKFPFLSSPLLKCFTKKALSVFIGWLIAGSLFAAAPTDIQLDQTGYLTNETKLAMVTNAAATGTFYVVNSSGPTTVFTGTLSAAVIDTNSGLSVRTADFSAVTATGTYTLNVAGLGQSYSFSIDPNVFSNAFYETIRFYYGQRCGIGVTVVNGANTWTHAACHTTGALNSDDPATFDPSSGNFGTKISTEGWHDAGDYGKYIVNANISVGELLWTYEWYQSVLKNFNLDLPESGNGTPDILNECRFELNWMLTMQDTDGGVWAKVSSAGFPAGPATLVMPENDNAGTRLIIGTNGTPNKDSGATAGFAAVMAIAARLYQPYDAAFSMACSQAAVTAWGWVSLNPTSYTTANPTGITTGVYGDGGTTSTPSYLLWAAAELYRTTGIGTYNTFFTTNYTHFAPLLSGTQYPQDWTDTKNLAYWSYFFTGKNGIQPVTAAVTTAIYNATIGSANTVIARQATDGYRVSLQTGDYIWGSNGGVGNYGILLLMANAMSPNASYVQSAMDDIHYLLGRNANKMSFVTDLGSTFQMNPHHRPSWSDGITLPWPGMLAGGPNQSPSGDGITPSSPGTKPALCYVDIQGAYGSNEEAINWNAPLVFVLASTLSASANTPTPTASTTPNSTTTLTATPTASPTATLTVTKTATSTPSKTATPSPTPTSFLTATNTPTPTFSATAFNTPTSTTSRTPTLTPTDTATLTPTQTATNTPTLTPTLTPSNTPTKTPTLTVTNTATQTPTSTSTQTATISPTPTVTSTPSNTPLITNTPSNTPTRTPTPTASNTATKTPTISPTLTPTITPTQTPTATPTRTSTLTPSPSSTASSTSTSTFTPSWTATLTPTNSSTPTATASNSAAQTPSNTPSLTPANTGTLTPTQTPTNTPSLSVTSTLSSTATLTSTLTPTPTDTGTNTPTITPTGSFTATITVTSPSAGVSLSSPYPNPSSDGQPVNIDIQLPGPATVKWAVFTTAFRKINSGVLSLSGSGTFAWDLKDKTGAPIARGIYYLRLEISGDFSTVKKVVKILVL